MIFIKILIFYYIFLKFVNLIDIPCIIQLIILARNFWRSRYNDTMVNWLRMNVYEMRGMRHHTQLHITITKRTYAHLPKQFRAIAESQVFAHHISNALSIFENKAPANKHNNKVKNTSK